MTKKDTAKFLDELAALYPHVIRSNMELMIKLWGEALQGKTYQEMHNALLKYFQNDDKGYFPTAGQLIELTKPEQDPFMPKDHEYYPPEEFYDEQ